MKGTLFILLFPMLLTAQRYTTLDTAYVVNDGGVFFEVKDVVWSSGERSTEKTLVGDTSAYFNAVFLKLQDRAAVMAKQAQVVFDLHKKIRAMKHESDSVLIATGKNPLDTITARFETALTDAGWKVRDTAQTDVSFSVNANGQLRYQIQGFATRNADIFGDVMLLNNYKSSGDDVFLFKTESENYRNREGSILLRKPGGALSREKIINLKPARAKKKRN